MATRSVIGIDRADSKRDWTDPANTVRKVLVLKSNFGLPPRPFGMQYTRKGLVFGPAPQVPQKETEITRAVKFLRCQLAKGERPATKVLDAAEQSGFSKKTIERARSALGVKARKRKTKWYWTIVQEGRTPTDPDPKS